MNICSYILCCFKEVISTIFTIPLYTFSKTEISNNLGFFKDFKRNTIYEEDTIFLCNTIYRGRSIMNVVYKFSFYLEQEGMSQNTVKGYTLDLRQYIDRCHFSRETKLSCQKTRVSKGLCHKLMTRIFRLFFQNAYFSRYC